MYSVWIAQAISDVKPEAVTLCRPMYKTLLCERAEVSVLRPCVLCTAKPYGGINMSYHAIEAITGPTKMPWHRCVVNTVCSQIVPAFPESSTVHCLRIVVKVQISYRKYFRTLRKNKHTEINLLLLISMLLQNTEATTARECPYVILLSFRLYAAFLWARNLVSTSFPVGISVS